MKTIFVFALLLIVCGPALASGDLKVPQLAPKREPVTVAPLPPLTPVADQLTAYAACMQLITEQCSGTHRTRIFTKACVFRNRYQCRGKS